MPRATRQPAAGERCSRPDHAWLEPRSGPRPASIAPVAPKGAAFSPRSPRAAGAVICELIGSRARIAGRSSLEQCDRRERRLEYADSAADVRSPRCALRVRRTSCRARRTYRATTSSRCPRSARREGLGKRNSTRRSSCSPSRAMRRAERHSASARAFGDPGGGARLQPTARFFHRVDEDPAWVPPVMHFRPHRERDLELGASASGGDKVARVVASANATRRYSRPDRFDRAVRRRAPDVRARALTSVSGHARRLEIQICSGALSRLHRHRAGPPRGCVESHPRASSTYRAFTPS